METVYRCVKCASFYPERVGFCSGCGAFESVVLCPSRTASNLWRQSSGASTAASLVKRSHQYNASKSYPSIRFGKQALVGIYGPPGAGKSTMMMKLLDGIEGDVLLLSLEEGLGETLIDRLRRLEIIRGDFHVAAVRDVEEVRDLISQISPVAFGLDSLSVSTLSADDLRRLCAECEIPVFFSLHVTKGGDPAGPMTVLHQADVVVRVDALRWRVEKSRFSGLIEGEV